MECFRGPGGLARRVDEGLPVNKYLYVGNIPYTSTADDLRDWFSDFGSVTRTLIATDQDTGHSRGFGFVEMADGADAAISALNGFRLEGRPLAVDVAQRR